MSFDPGWLLRKNWSNPDELARELYVYLRKLDKHLSAPKPEPPQTPIAVPTAATIATGEILGIGHGIPQSIAHRIAAIQQQQLVARGLVQVPPQAIHNPPAPIGRVPAVPPEVRVPVGRVAPAPTAPPAIQLAGQPRRGDVTTPDAGHGLLSIPPTAPRQSLALGEFSPDVGRPAPLGLAPIQPPEPVPIPLQQGPPPLAAKVPFVPAEHRLASLSAPDTRPDVTPYHSPPTGAPAERSPIRLPSQFQPGPPQNNQGLPPRPARAPYWEKRLTQFPPYSDGRLLGMTGSDVIQGASWGSSGNPLPMKPGQGQGYILDFDGTQIDYAFDQTPIRFNNLSTVPVSPNTLCVLLLVGEDLFIDDVPDRVWVVMAPASGTINGTWVGSAPGSGAEFQGTVYEVYGSSVAVSLGTQTCVNWMPAPLAASKACYCRPDLQGNFAIYSQSCQ